MQLLDSEQLEYAFQLHGISLEVQARQFYIDLWSTIQRAEKIYDIPSLSLCEQDLRRLCHSYFAITREWQEDEAEQNESTPSCQASRDNAREAFAALNVFEKHFYRYALCYLELNRALIQVRAHLSHFAKDYNIDDAEDVLQVNHSTGALLDSAHKERAAIMETRLRMDRVRNILKDLDPLMEKLGILLPRVFDHDQGDHILTKFKAALRKEKFDQVNHIVKNWHDKELREVGFSIVDMTRKNVTELRAHDGLMLHTRELGLIAAFLKADEDRINRFLDKFNVPYMVFQYKNLIHQGYLLGRIGSIEGLIIQHAKLISLSARPHNDAGYAQVQEQAVLVPTRLMLQNKFRSLGAIFDDMETTLSVLDKLFAKTREYKAPLQK